MGGVPVNAIEMRTEALAKLPSYHFEISVVKPTDLANE
jgi:hypothetical protein